MNETCRVNGGANDMELAPTWRYISVALFLRSLWAGVTRYPCPVEPGISSWTAFRPVHATVCFTRGVYFTGKEPECQRKPAFRECISNGISN